MTKQYRNLDRLWELIVDDVRNSQRPDGSTTNPVVNNVYFREAAFSASILATNALIFANKVDAGLATLNKNFLYEKMNKNGVIFDEPIWTPRGESVRKGSLPATVYLFEALDSACKRLGEEPLTRKFSDELLNYLKNCEIREGIFAHDAISPENGTTVFPVINTSLMAIWLRKQLASHNETKLDKQLRKQQRSSGLWPYLYSGFFFERVLDRISLMLPEPTSLIKICRKLLKDRSFFFSDFHHHAVCLQYYLKVTDNISYNRKKIIMKAWRFIEKKILFHQERVSLDFSWEPQPNFPRYSNFKDTTTYFIVMEILYLLYEKKIVDKTFVLETSEGFSAHILQNLVLTKTKDGASRVNPYEGSTEEVNLIFPRPAESVHHKGHLMSNVILLSNR